MVSEIDSVEKDIWANHGALSDIALLSYTTPLKKNVITKKDIKEDLSHNYCAKDKRKVLDNLFHDSWFEEVDLSLLEKECSIKDKKNLHLPDNEQVLSNKNKSSDQIKSMPKLTESTPKSEKPKSNFRMRLRKT